MSIGERIKQFRKSIKKTQAEFGKTLGVGRDTMTNYEIGRVSPPDTFIQLLSTKYNISEEWLRTGEGSMYQETDTTLFAAFAKRYALTEEEQAVARYLLALSSEERQAVLHHVLALSDTVRALKFDRNGKAAAPVADRPPDHKMTMEERHALIQEEMEKEKAAATSDHSMRSNGIV